MKNKDEFALSHKMRKCAERLISQEFDGNISMTKRNLSSI